MKGNLQTSAADRANPFVEASFVSRIFFCWINALVKKGYRKELDCEDLYEITEENTSGHLAEKLQQEWTIELDRHRRAGRQPSYRRALLRCFKSQLVALALFTFGEEAARIAQPLLLARMLSYFTLRAELQDKADVQAASIVHHISALEAYMYALGLTLTSAITVFMHHPRYFHSVVMGMQMRVASCSLVFRKALRLPSVSSGCVVNLVSADVARLDYGFMFVHYMWLAPVLAAIVLGIIWTHLGLASLPGFAMVLLMAPLQRIQGRFNTRLRYKSAKATDSRMSLMTQIINGIKVIKMYCWEKPFAEHVATARSEEMRFVGAAVKIKFILMELGSFIFSKLATASCILTFVLMHGRMPPLATVLIVMRLLGTVQDSVAFSMSHAVIMWGEIVATCRRVQEFLMCEEIEATSLQQTSCTEDAFVELRSFSGTWFQAGTATAALAASHPTLALDCVSARASAGELLAIAGPVGGGKTSVLMALLGELRCTSGERLLRGRVAYAAQEAWMFPASLRENIVFGSQFCPERYAAVLDSCDLTSDVASLPHGDQTLVGERGVKLSGGQRARVGLARVAYSNAEVCLLDDPLSAVDTEVAERIVARCLNGLLKGRCRVLVTHQCHLLELASRILVVEGGKVTASGRYLELVQSGVNFGRLLDRSCKRLADGIAVAATVHYGDYATAPAEAATEGEVASLPRNSCEKTDKWSGQPPLVVGYAESTVNKDGDESVAPERDPLLLTRPAAVTDSGFGAGDASDDALTADRALKAVVCSGEVQHDQPESHEQGAVAAGTYWTYFHSGCNACVLAIVALVMALGQASFMLTDWYISHWATIEDDVEDLQTLRSNGTPTVDFHSTLSSAGPNSTDTTVETISGIISYATVPTFSTFFPEVRLTELAINLSASSSLLPATKVDRIYLYVGLVAGLVFVSFLRALAFYQVCLNASKKLHDHMFTSVVFTHMRFFDTQPAGRIIQRFSKDTDVLDAQVPPKFFEFLTFALMVVGAVALASYSNPWVMLLLVPVIVALIFVQRFYVRSSRALKRLEAIRRSPMVSHLNSMLAGLHTVRAYGVQDTVARQLDERQDGYTEAFYLSQCVSRWLGIRLDWMSVLFVASVTFLCVAARDSLSLSADLFGLTVTYTVALMGLFQWAVRLSVEVESLMTSVERLVEYTQLPSEIAGCSTLLPQELGRLAESHPMKSPPAGWPTAGHIEAQNLCLRYSPDDPEVLRNITFDIRGSEKIGVCGRTGSGKSTLLTVALFRLAEPTGRLIIDGVPITGLDVHELRSKISIIPQHPVLFQTTVRRNLDPLGEYADSVLWDALVQVQLADLIRELPGALDSPLTENGANFSVGQRQLLCLARAVIHRNRILVVDEATANVDLQTDAAIQQTIREQFKDCTVLTIAHRLETIANSDRVMVLDGGCIYEFDCPFVLLQRSGSMFRALAEHTRDGYERLYETAKAAREKRQADRHA